MNNSKELFANFVGETKEIVLKSISLNLNPLLTDNMDDVVQETYLRAWKSFKRGNFRGDSKISTWLYVIARNESRRMNKKYHKRIGDSKSIVEELSDNIESCSYDDIFSAISRLPNDLKELFELKLKGFTELEISKELNLPVGTIKSRTSRGRLTLRQLLNSN